LITGRDPRRFGYESNLNRDSKFYFTRVEYLGLPTNEYTLGDHLKAAGYRTACVGKWHLGDGDAFYPTRRGFDYFCGFRGGSSTYFPSAEMNKNQIERNGLKVTEFSSSYLTDFFTDEAIRWMQGSGTNRDDSKKPFFLYLAYNAPHGPLEATPEDLKHFSQISDPKRRTYAAMVYAMDRGVGRVLDWLKDHNQTNTLIVFFSDNGGPANGGAWNGPLSGTKGTLLEGGIRVPMVWYWPGQIPAGKRCESVVSSLDLLPSFLAAAGGKALPLQPAMPYEDANNRRRASELYGDYDGINVLPGFLGTLGPERTLFWRLQGQRAELRGDYKLIVLSHRLPQLFNTRLDISESRDLFSSQPDLAKDFYKRLGQWEASLSTTPMFYESPHWTGDSAKLYDTWGTPAEPQ